MRYIIFCALIVRNLLRNASQCRHGRRVNRAPAQSLAMARRLLNSVLPAWIDWVVTTGEGFFCDGGDDGSSLLDLKGLGS